ncbi:M20 family metallopeptidase [Asticcacaulis sp. AND118]|uniref:M20 metallopeptidase family protein n=1 Tax=Asticcacaulis sp. AND118 TaxID=2840468 RepID=UPI001CFF6EAB|nr:amidohydrolase [Asticcacaulis sp. AND118]UDF05238.1 amidohydrolase [Asticcacaulis sp. AND118]
MRRLLPVVTAALIGLGAPALAEPDYVAAIRADYNNDLAALWDGFHRNPELSMLETKTAARMAKELRAAGAEVTEKVGGTGVVAIIPNGPGPVVMLRADMDGLPVKEASGLANASTAKQVGMDGVEYPVMHACGHDTHITAMVATVRQLQRLKAQWKGTVVVVIQPGEERVMGAKAMLKDGLYTRFPKPDYALAFHVNSQMPTGKVSASESIQYSSSDSIDIHVHGVGAHGASPHLGKDPVYIGSQIVIALQGLISRERPPLSPGVITVGAFRSGSKHNIISDAAELQVTVRANDEATRAQLVSGVKRVAENMGRVNGLPDDKLPEVKVSEGTPTTINDAALARRLNGAIASALGADTVIPFEQMGMGAEDFAYFVQPDLKVPGYYFAVGGTPQATLDAAKAGGPAVPSHHSPLFKVDAEAAIVTGASAMTAAVLDLMKP